MRGILKVVCVSMIALSPNLQAGTTVVGRAGPLEFAASTVDVSPSPGHKATESLQATLGFEIKNTGAYPVRLAFVPAWPVLQLVGAGTQFNIRSGGIVGVYFQNIGISNCARYSDNFTLLSAGESLTASMVFDASMRGRELPSVREARFSGSLLVQSTKDSTCQIRSFSASSVGVKISR